jgi:hypothetical protein
MKKETIYSTIFILINIPIWFFNRLVVHYADKSFQEMLEGEPLPYLTGLLISVPNIWIIFLLAFIGTAVISFYKQKVALHMLLILTAIEILSLALFVIGITLPIISLTKTIGG